MLLVQQDRGFFVQFTAAPLLEDYGIPLALMGILVVFLALALVVGFISLLPRVLSRFDAAQLTQPSAPRDAMEEELSDETLVVISAAVAVAMGRPRRIVRIRGVTSQELGWTLEGRMQHHRSHMIKHRDRQ